MKMVSKIVNVLFLFVLSSCGFTYIPDEDLPDGEITLVNKSNKTVFFRYDLKQSESDTLLMIERPKDYQIDKYQIAPNSKYIEEIWIDGYQNVLNSKVHMYYFFDLDSMRKYPWDTIVKRNMILKRVQICSWQQLVDSNFTITYP